MNLPTTLAVMAVAALFFGLSLWGTRRRRPLGQISYVPWNGLLFTSLVTLLLMAAHLLTLWGTQPPHP